MPAASSPAPYRSGAALTGQQEIAPQHRTEVTIDEVLMKLSEITEAGFSRHEGSLRLVERCRKLLSRLDEFGVELTTTHNVTGPRTHQSLRRQIERVELMLAKIQEMGALSLAAAELSESVESEMFDEYKPIAQETVDRGLRTPSARIHNES